MKSGDIKYDIISVKEDELKNQGYMKLPGEVFERINVLLQNVPGQIAQHATGTATNKAVEEVTKNAYKLVLDEGLHLGKSKSLTGAFKGLAYNAQGKLETQADWIPVSLESGVTTYVPQIALGVFNVMSIATGQYFMSQINGKLEDIEVGLADIMDYLQVEKRSEVSANDLTIIDIYSNLEYIMANEFERQSTSAELKEIKRQSLTNILLFKAKIDSTKQELKLTAKSKYDDLQKVFEELWLNFPQYWCATRSYINATVLDAIVAEMDDPHYLEGIKKDLTEKLSQYKEECNDIDRRIRKFIEKAKAFNKRTKLPKELRLVVTHIPTYDTVSTVIKAAALGIVGFDEQRVSKARSDKKKALDDRVEFWEACTKFSPLEEPIALLDDYNNNRNSPVELIYTANDAYIKCGKVKG